MSGYTLRFKRTDGSGFHSEDLKAEDHGEAQLLSEIRFLMSPEFDHMALLQNDVTIYALSRGVI